MRSQDPSLSHDPSGWRLERLSIRHDVSVHRTPISYFAERVRRLQYFSLARFGPDFWAVRAREAEPAEPERRQVHQELVQRLSRLSVLDADLFIATEGHPGGEPSRDDEDRFAAMERTLPPGYVAEDAGLLRRATLDGTIRALYDAIRCHPVVAIGPPGLIELAGPLRLSRFELKAVTERQGLASRHALLEQIALEHLAFCREPVTYLFDAGAVSPWWILELHGRIANAFLLDVGPVLDACIPERVMRAGWGRIHWRAVAQHLGLDSGQRRAAPDPGAWHRPRPWEAPGRLRSERRAPAVDRRQSAWRRPEIDPASARADGPLERIFDGDLERCLSEVIASGDRR